MAEDETNRRLAAILAADVVGYSRMMGADETGTLAALKRHREAIFDPAVTQHRGRIVKLIGDGTLVEFPSVVDAVRCALDIQRTAMTGAGSANIILRIGINLGDVIIEGDDIYGDGVNIAARLEPLAEPGGICVASIVHESVGNRIDVAFRDAGEVTVKNIDRPIRVWKWHPGAEPGRPAAPPTTRPVETAIEQASIAVLPFNNMSGDPEQEYFSDGITEDIITDLSKVGGLLVIARNSSFAYKGKSPDIRTVGRELGVSSVLEGSIRRAGNRVRINAQLISAVNGGHLWADRYDRDLTDIFAVQDEVTRHIVDALRVKLTPAEATRIADVPTQNPEAHDLFLRARELLNGQRIDRSLFDEAVPLLRRAIELDPNYAEPYAGLGMAHNLDHQNRWTGNPDAFDLSVRYANQAVEKGPEVPYVLYVAAVIETWLKDLAKARRHAQAALAVNPNYALGLGVLGIVEIYSGNAEAALPLLERAIRLNPSFTHQYVHFIGTAYLVLGRYEAAAATFRERIRLLPNTDLSRGLLIAALGHLGEIDAAQAVRGELHQLSPTYTFAGHLARLPFAIPEHAIRIREGLAKAGITV